MPLCSRLHEAPSAAAVLLGLRREFACCCLFARLCTLASKHARPRACVHRAALLCQHLPAPRAPQRLLPPCPPVASWLADHLDVGAPAEVNLFETTIRILGGLLSAQVGEGGKGAQVGGGAPRDKHPPCPGPRGTAQHAASCFPLGFLQALSAESHPELSRALAEKATELGARLLPAFDSPSGGRAGALACRRCTALPSAARLAFRPRMPHSARPCSPPLGIPCSRMRACCTCFTALVSGQCLATSRCFPCWHHRRALLGRQPAHCIAGNCDSTVFFCKPTSPPAGVPYSDVSLRTGRGSVPDWGHVSSLSEISSVSLEFTYLARWVAALLPNVCRIAVASWFHG